MGKTTREIEIDDKVWEMVSKFSKAIKWEIDRVIELLLEQELDYYLKAGINDDPDASLSIYQQFLEKPILKELTTIFESNTD